jgi:hypothetical protein
MQGHPKPPDEIFKSLGGKTKMLDDRFLSISGETIDPQSKQPTLSTTGFIEQYDERFFAYYTCEESVEAKKRVAKWVQAPDLDYAWFSSPLLQVFLLWMAKEQPQQNYYVNPFFHDLGFKILYIEHPFRFPDKTAKTMIDSGLDIGVEFAYVFFVIFILTQYQ